MAGGITIKSSNVAAVRTAFREYARYNLRDIEFLALDTSRRLATDLYVETEKIAPTPGEIAAKVVSLGWRLVKRGTEEDWLRFGFFRARREVRAGKHGRTSRRDQAAIDAKANSESKLKAMQAYVIAKRVQAIKFLASGWLGAVAILGGSLKATSGDVDFDRGGAIVRRTSSGIEVEMWNRSPGIETMDRKKHFVAKAIKRRILDMRRYIRTKMAGAMPHGQWLRAA